MTNDRRDRIRAYIKYLETIKKSLQEILDDEVAEWKDTPESIKTKSMLFDHLEVLSDLRGAISQIELSIWDLEHTEVDK